MNYKGIELAELEDSEVLFFVRIHGKKGIFGVYYPEIFLNEFKKLQLFRTISEYRVGDVYINLEDQQIADINSDDFEIFKKMLDIDDIIVRCRGLREISYHEARQLIWKVGKFFINYFSQNPSLKVIVSLAVDNYVLDVMTRIAEHFNIKVIHLIGLFVPGHMRFVDKGGMGIPIREVEKNEVESLYQRFVNREPSHLAINKNRALKNAARDYISYKYRFWVRYIWGYRINGNLSYEYRFAKYLKGFNSLNKLFISSYFDAISDIDKNPEKSIFIPLHYHPEATVDYWTDRKEHADYLNSLIEVISFFREKKITVVLKEHPNYYLRRSRDFYKMLKSFNNVILLDPYIPSQSLFDKIENVGVHTGSVGVESLIADKKVYAISENYYSLLRLPHLADFGKPYPYYTEEEKKTLLENILKSTIKT